MPVTAKLSRKFYEKLGDEVANELVEWFNSVDATYRSDLRELNELNFARFDAKVEQRWAQLDAKLEQRVAELRAEMQAGFAGLRAEIQAGFVRVDAMLDQSDSPTRTSADRGLLCRVSTATLWLGTGHVFLFD